MRRKRRVPARLGNLILQVGVIGSAGSEEYPKGWKPAKGLSKAVKKIGALLGEKGATIVTGGGGGIMRDVSREGIRKGSIAIGIFNRSNEIGIDDVYTVGFTTGMLEGGPEYLLPLCCEILIAVSGGAGTLNEITVAYRNEIPVVLLRGYGGWVDQVIGQLREGKYLDERRRIPFYVAESPEESVEIAFREGMKRLKQALKQAHTLKKKQKSTGKRKIV